MIDPKLQALINAVVNSTRNKGCSGDLVVAGKPEIAALEAYVEQLSQEDYANSDGYVCPYCQGEDIIYDGHVRLHTDKCYHDCKCGDCEKTWTEEYTLTGYA